MIDVYSTGKLLKEGRILDCEKGTGYSKKYFEEAKKFGKEFGTYVLDKECPPFFLSLRLQKRIRLQLLMRS
jgi:hypothetical protein